MNEELQKWEYRVLTIGNMLGTRDEHIESVLNEMGLEGWEATHVYTPSGSGKITIVAKRPLTREMIRRRSMPSYSKTHA